jgi:hypothetical protein
VEEVELQAGPDRPVVRIGDTVRRKPNWWTPAVHDLLAYLNATGFAFAPTLMGFDDQGREVLSYIEGVSGPIEGRRCVVADEGLAAYARLLRVYHDAVAGYRPPPDADWADGPLAPQPGDIMCHGDFGPWNLVWQGTEPVGIIDWDLAYPGPPLDDVAYALAYSIPFRDDAHAMRWNGFTEPPARRRRMGVFADAYGIDAAGLVDAVVDRQRKYSRHLRYLHDRGLRAKWTTTESRRQADELAPWSEANRGLFE